MISVVRLLGRASSAAWMIAMAPVPKPISSCGFFINHRSELREAGPLSSASFSGARARRAWGSGVKWLKTAIRAHRSQRP